MSVGLDFSERMLERARRKASDLEWVQGDVLALPFENASFDAAVVGFGVRNVENLEGGLKGAAPRASPRRPARDPRDHDAARGARAVLSALVRPDRAAARPGPAGWRRVHVPAGERTPLPRPRGARGAARLVRVRGRAVPALRRGYRGPARRGGGFVSTSLAGIRSVPGLDDYLEALEERLARTVATHPGLVAAVGNEALAAGGKRLRPALVFLSAPPGEEPSLTAGVAVELVHMATLVHDDLIDRAHFRRGKAAAWSIYGPAAARATGDYLFARAFSELSATGDATAVEILADATLCLARGEALQRTQTRDPGTTIEAYLERCALKTGKLFEAACRLGGGSGEYGLSLGIAFQIADDVLDCSGATIETGKIAGTDLRDGTPTLPAPARRAAGCRRARGSRGRAHGRRARARRGDGRSGRGSRGGARLR